MSESDAHPSVAVLPDEELLAELERRGLKIPVVANDAAEHVNGAAEDVVDLDDDADATPSEIAIPSQIDAPSTIEAPSQIGTPSKIGPRGGPLIPEWVAGPAASVRFRITGNQALRGSTEHVWEQEHGLIKGGSSTPQRTELAKLSGDNIGTDKSTRVLSPDNSELYRILHYVATKNDGYGGFGQFRWSFRILPAGSDNLEDAVYTVNRDIIGCGAMGLREQWRVYRGRQRDNKMLMYAVSSIQGFQYKVYRTEADYTTGCGRALATIDLVEGTGKIDSKTKTWIPTEYTVVVSPSEDSALILSFATILDMTHERSKPKTLAPHDGFPKAAP